MSIIRTALLVGAGYILGTRAGRERYEQIKSYASNITDKIKEAGSARAKNAAAGAFEQVKNAATTTAAHAAQTVKNKVNNSSTARAASDENVIVVEAKDVNNQKM